MPDSTTDKLKKAIALLVGNARERGFVTPADVAEALPDDGSVDDAIQELARAGVPVAEARATGPGRDDPVPAAAASSDPGADVATPGAPSPGAPAMGGARKRRALDAPGDGADTVSLYLRELGAIPLLTAADEVALAQLYERGREAQERLGEAGEKGDDLSAQEVEDLKAVVTAGADARERMIQANGRLVVHIAKKYVNNGVPFQDLIQEGNLGLIRATEKFDYHLGFKFSTYATYWIRQAITRAIADQARTIRVPVHMSEQIAKLKAASRRLEQDLGRDPTMNELAGALGVTPRRVEQIIEVAQRPLSLEMRVGDDADSELGDFIRDDESPAPNEEAGREFLREELGVVLNSLTPREAAVLELRYGLADGTPLTLEEVGARFGVTRERIRQIETKAIRRLRHPTRSRRLRDYLR
ncbi:MAG: sigma-70 family RNA polymerase sigma factor [Anaerolineae bacterium]